MIKLEATNGMYTVYNGEIPQLGGIAYSSLEEAYEQVGLEEWFNCEMRGLNRPLYVTDIVEYRREWGLPLGKFEKED